MAEAVRSIVYGAPPPELVEAPAESRQVSPVRPGSGVLEDLAEGTLEAAVVLAPAGAVERRYVLAQTLRALAPGGRLTALAPKDRGGLRLKKELSALGLPVEESAKAHHRICSGLRPEGPLALAAALAEGAPRLDARLGLWTQPGVFAWDRIDPGTALLLEHLPALAGEGADLGCGLGVLGHAVLRSDKVRALTLADLDRRAIEAARRNLSDPRARFAWTDLRIDDAGLADLDFAVTNPPFHDGGAEDRALGQAFVARAAGLLRKGGSLWLVANRHLPYEAALRDAFARVRLVVEDRGYKVYEAVR